MRPIQCGLHRLLKVIFMLVLALILSLQPVPDVDCPDDANGDPSDCEHRCPQFTVLHSIELWIQILLRTSTHSITSSRYVHAFDI